MNQSPQQYNIASFKDYPWSSRQDIYDYYDLRYLFDDDEILESKRQLIEDDGKIFWHTYDDDDEEEEENANANEPVIINNVNMEVDEEDWDEDEDWEVRFEYGRGFYNDGYDSGYDEPFKRREAYPGWYNADEDMEL